MAELALLPSVIFLYPFCKLAVSKIRFEESTKPGVGIPVADIFFKRTWRQVLLTTTFLELVSCPSKLLLWDLQFLLWTYKILQPGLHAEISDLLQSLGKAVVRYSKNRFKFKPDQDGTQLRSRRLLWELLLHFSQPDAFQSLYVEAWTRRLSFLGTISHIYLVFDETTIRVPILDSGSSGGNDQQTVARLHMWYSLLETRNGLRELVLPKRLARIDLVTISGVDTGAAIVGKRVRTLNLGKRGSNRAALLDHFDEIDSQQHEVTEAITKDPYVVGLEFVREWDGYAISMVVITPLLASLVFAIVWIAVSMGRYQVDAQVAVQTAFTVSSFIVTAGALIIAIVAFLDGQENARRSSR